MISKKRKDEILEEYFKVLPKLPGNDNVLKDYVKYLDLQGLKLSTIRARCWSIVPFFSFVENKKAEDVTKEDIEKFYLDLKQKSGKKISTQRKNMIETRDFFNWLKSDNDFFSGIKLVKPKPDTSEHEYVTSEDVAAMLPHCISQRDRALIFLTWESAARLGEILALNVGDIKLDKYGIKVKVTGKTGTRDIRVIDCVPDVQLWLNQYKGNPDSPLFPIDKRNGRLAHRGAQSIVLRLQQKAGLTNKRIWIHGFRHGRLTELSNQGMTEPQLRIFAGWGKDSEMPSTYIHANQKDMESKLLSIKGIKLDEEEEIKIKLTPHKCPRCGSDNTFDAMYCRSCSMVLSQSEAMKIEAEEKSRSDEIQFLKDEINKLKQAMEDKKQLERNFEQIISFEMGTINRTKGWKQIQKEHDTRMKNEPEYADKFKEYEKVFYAEYFGAPNYKELNNYKDEKLSDSEKLNKARDKLLNSK